MYAAYGVASPFLPAFLHERGLSPEQLGVVLAVGTAVRLIAAPVAGRIGDLIQGLRVVLVACIALAAVATFGYLAAHGFRAFLVINLLHAAALAPITILADALALGAASPRPAASGTAASATAYAPASGPASGPTCAPASSLPNSGRQGFEYGWVRGTGSAAFIAALLLSGLAVSRLGLDVIVWLQAALLGAAAVVALLIPELVHARTADAVRAPARGILVLLRMPLFRNLVLVAALILGSHAMQDAFAMIRWRAAGIGPGTASLLWSESVAAEVLVFFLLGPAIVKRLTPAGAIGLAALAGMLRWTVMALTSDVMALALVQPLHGFTFALLHLACMRLIARAVPQGLEGTAQAIYGTVGVGGATALLTLASGALYARLGAQAFWVMAALCALAFPLTWTLRQGAVSESVAR
jgi:PPP family 3-phenylpropionic acid transporter